MDIKDMDVKTLIKGSIVRARSLREARKSHNQWVFSSEERDPEAIKALGRVDSMIQKTAAEARALHLLRGCRRGRTYHQMESHTKKPVNAQKLLLVALKYELWWASELDLPKWLAASPFGA